MLLHHYEKGTTGISTWFKENENGEDEIKVER